MVFLKNKVIILKSTKYQMKDCTLETENARSSKTKLQTETTGLCESIRDKCGGVIHSRSLELQHRVHV